MARRPFAPSGGCGDSRLRLSGLGTFAELRRRVYTSRELIIVRFALEREAVYAPVVALERAHGQMRGPDGYVSSHLWCLIQSSSNA